MICLRTKPILSMRKLFSWGLCWLATATATAALKIDHSGQESERERDLKKGEQRTPQWTKHKAEEQMKAESRMVNGIKTMSNCNCESSLYFIILLDKVISTKMKAKNPKQKIGEENQFCIETE